MMVLRSGALVLVLAVASALLVVAATPALADDTVETKMICGFADPAVWNADTEKNAYDTELIITAPASVAPGETFDVTVDAEPMKNGPVGIRSPGDAVIAAIWKVSGSTADGEVESDTWENPEPIGVLEEYDIDPLVLSVTAGDSGSVDLEWQKFQLLAIGTITLVCSAFEPDGSGTLLFPEISVAIGGSSGGTSTTTTTAPATTTTVAATTTTTEVEDTEPYVAQTVTSSASIPYACVTTVGGNEVSSDESLQSVMIAAVDKVNSGDDFSVSMGVSPGPMNEGDAVAAGFATPSGLVEPSEAGEPSPIELEGSAIEEDIPSGAAFPITVMQGTVKAVGEVGSVIELRPSTFQIDVPDDEMTVECAPVDGSPVVLSTEVVSQPVDLPNDGDLRRNCRDARLL
ncbi:MAG: hypothetical protein ACR2N2_01710 [Acidimicrobiia bacterium]